MFMNIKYIIGDLHLGDQFMFNRYYSKYFETHEDYWKGLTLNWNRVVQPQDVVLILGDLGTSKEVLETVLPKLRGRKILIMGNHDKYSKEYYGQFFEQVYDHPLFIKSRVVASHIPVPVEAGVLNIHGHTHHIFLKSDWHMNICPEYSGFKLLNVEKLVNSFFSQNNYKPNYRFLQEWFKDIQTTVEQDRAQEFILKPDGTIDAEATLAKGLKEKKKEGFEL